MSAVVTVCGTLLLFGTWKEWMILQWKLLMDIFLVLISFNDTFSSAWCPMALNDWGNERDHILFNSAEFN